MSSPAEPDLPSGAAYRQSAAGDGGAKVAELIASRLRDVPDFPHDGVLFKDIVPLLADGDAFGRTVAALAAFAGALGDAAGSGIELVAGVEARGFVVAGALARELDCGLVPVRKAGKLPPPTVRGAYTLEYGTAEIEVPVDVLAGQRVLLVDDVLATGGTLRAAAGLIGEAGGTLAGIAVLLELGFLSGRAQIADLAPVHALLRV